MSTRCRFDSLNTEVEIHEMTVILVIICVVLDNGDGSERDSEGSHQQGFMTTE
jgi:hypothetical protein